MSTEMSSDYLGYLIATNVKAALAAQAAELEALKRWKSTNAPRLEALQGLLTHEQHEAHAGREARASLASEREANAILTAEVEALRKANEHFGKRQKWWDEKMFSLEQERDALREELRLCCELTREYQTQVASMVDEVEALRGLVAEWEKLRDPVTLHVSLLRGFPARLPRSVFLHLAGDDLAGEEPKF